MIQDLLPLTGLSHPFFENGAGAYGIGKIWGVLTKIEKFEGYSCNFLGPSLYMFLQTNIMLYNEC